MALVLKWFKGPSTSSHLPSNKLCVTLPTLAAGNPSFLLSMTDVSKCDVQKETMLSLFQFFPPSVNVNVNCPKLGICHWKPHRDIDNLLDMNRRDVTQSWRENQPDDVQSLAMEDGAVPLNNLSQKAWWLDVASPTSEDMRMLGMVHHSGWLRTFGCLSWRIQLLHLHPFTLEDILEQGPREKVEILPQLGYYLVVIHSVDLNKYLDARDLEHDMRMTHAPNTKDSVRSMFRMFI